MKIFSIEFNSNSQPTNYLLHVFLASLLTPITGIQFTFYWLQHCNVMHLAPRRYTAADSAAATVSIEKSISQVTRRKLFSSWLFISALPPHSHRIRWLHAFLFRSFENSHKSNRFLFSLTFTVLKIFSRLRFTSLPGAKRWAFDFVILGAQTYHLQLVVIVFFLGWF